MIKNISNHITNNSLFAGMSETDIKDYIASVNADTYISDSSYIDS